MERLFGHCHFTLSAIPLSRSRTSGWRAVWSAEWVRVLPEALTWGAQHDPDATYIKRPPS